MKLLFIYLQLITLLFLGSKTLAQKYDYNWAMGFGFSDTIVDPYQGNKVFIMKFGQAQLMFDTVFDSYNEKAKRFIYLDRDGIGCYSDVNGNFKYATDGRRIYDASWNVMQNGDSINIGPKWNSYLEGHPIRYGITPIPDPYNNIKYSYLLHTTLIKPGLSHIPKYTKIDLDANNGLGAVLLKNVQIFENIDSLEQTMVVQHANGRDWWVFCHKFKTRKYYKKLLTPDGFIDKGFQEDGPNESSNNFFISTSGMSNKGDKYCRYDPVGKYRICDFDRCTGELSNFKLLLIPDSLINTGKICFSPSGQFIYSTGKSDITNFNYLTQIDISTEPAIYKIISHFPLDNDLECVGFNYIELGPDGKLYVGPYGPSKCFNSIDNPDEPYPACHFHQYLSFLPYFTAIEGAIPHFTNYRLGALIGSGCDTISGIKNLSVKIENSINIYPNPATSNITLELKDFVSYSKEIEVSLIDVSGKQYYQDVIASNTYVQNIDIQGLNSGIYCILIKDKFKLLAVKKFMVFK